MKENSVWHLISAILFFVLAALTAGVLVWVF